VSTKILIIEDNPKDAGLFKHVLELEDYAVEIATTAAEGFSQAQSGNFDVVLTDLNLGGPKSDEGRDLVIQLHTSKPQLPVILMTGGHTAEIAIDVIKQGGFDYFVKPLRVMDESFRADVVRMVDQAAASKQLMESGVKLPGETVDPGQPAGDQIIGNSRIMQGVYKEIGRVASTTVTVLIRGETGTGKELVARAIYSHSERASQPFIVVNCTAIPESLLESELFGHEPGAFTGATVRRLGRFEQAHRGTIFLDEIGDMEMKLQQKLLRVLQEQVIERVGGKEPIPVDVRVIAATHANLEQAIEESQFRQDLYFRLNVAQISLPPLRNRMEDIRPLVRYFIQRYGAELGSATSSIENEAIMALREQSWPGNVRELKGVVRKALLLAHGYTITTDIIRKALDQTTPPKPSTLRRFAAHVAEALASAQSGERENVMADLIEIVERELYGQAIRRAKRDQSKAAQWLGVSRPTMRQKLSRYGLHQVRDRSTRE
jgi:DNA-binding NtrC family response regulator